MSQLMKLYEPLLSSRQFGIALPYKANVTAKLAADSEQLKESKAIFMPAFLNQRSLLEERGPEDTTVKCMSGS